MSDHDTVDETQATEVTPSTADAPSPAENPAAAPAPRGILITPRRLLIGVAILLGAILILLLIYLLLLMSRNDYSIQVSDEAVNGLRAERVILGPGRGSLPRFSRPMGVAWDERGRYFYVADTENNRICTFDENGRFINQFGGQGIAKPAPGVEPTWDPGELNYPVSLDTDSEGNVYVADFYNDSISVFGPNGEFLRRFPDPNKPTGKGSSGQEGGGIAVTAVAVQGDKVYATDSFQVFIFSLDGRLLRQFGKPGTELGALDRPNGITVGEDGTIYVSDSNNNRVQAFNDNGSPMWETAAAKASSEETLSLVLPRGLTLTDGPLIVADPLSQHLVEVTIAGSIVASYGDRGVNPGELNFPNDVDHSDGRLLVADRENNRVQICRLVPE